MDMQMNKRPHPKNPPSKKIANEIKLSVIGYYTTLAIRLLGGIRRRPQAAVRRPPWTQMPLHGNKLRMTTSPRVTLGSWKKLWLVTCGSLFVKTCYYTQIGCGQISLVSSSSTAVRFSSRLTIPYSHDLTG